MAGDTSVSLEGMKAAQGNFQNALEQCNTAYTSITEQQSVLAGNWTGEAASAFGQALTNYLDDLQIVRTQLSNITEQLSQNTGVYANTNEGSTQLANQFSTGLPGLSGI